MPTETDDDQISLLDEPLRGIEQQFQLPLDVGLERQESFFAGVVVHDENLVGRKARLDQLGRQIARVGAGKPEAGEIRIFVDPDEQPTFGGRPLSAASAVAAAIG